MYTVLESAVNIVKDTEDCDYIQRKNYFWNRYQEEMSALRDINDPYQIQTVFDLCDRFLTIVLLLNKVSEDELAGMTFEEKRTHLYLFGEGR